MRNTSTKIRYQKRISLASERQVGKDKILGSVSPSAPNQVMGRAIANIARHCLHPEQIEDLYIWVENRNSRQNHTTRILIENMASNADGFLTMQLRCT